MLLDEWHHAFLVGSFYRHLINTCGNYGKDIFVLATRTYGEERGRRIAGLVQDAGEELTYRNYIRFGDRLTSERFNRENTKGLPVVISVQPQYITEVNACPWFDTFHQMHLDDICEVYCTNIDESLLRGYNPAIDFHTVQTLHTGSCCRFVVNGQCMSGTLTRVQSAQINMTEHCKWLCRVFISSIQRNIQDTAIASAIIQAALNDFKDAWGEDAFAALNDPA